MKYFYYINLDHLKIDQIPSSFSINFINSAKIFVENNINGFRLAFFFFALLLILLSLNIRGNGFKKQIINSLFYILSFFQFITLSLYFKTTTDDVFINLVHSKNLLMGKGFVFDTFVNVEATVAFFFYYLVGLLSHLLYDVEINAMILSFASSFLTLLVFHKICCYFTKNKLIALVSLFLLSSNLTFVFTSLSMYETSMLSLIILLIIYSMINNKLIFAYFLIGILPLMRAEYFGFIILFAFLGIVKHIWFQRDSKKQFVFMLLFTLTPLIVITIYRLNYYGYLMPIPYYLNRTFIDFYAIRIMSPLIFAFLYENLFVVSLIISCYFLVNFRKITLYGSNCSRWLNNIDYLIIFIFSLNIFSLPYLSSGFRTLASSWGRYFLPQVTISYIVIILFYDLYKSSVFDKIKFIPSQLWLKRTLIVILIASAYLFPHSNFNKAKLASIYRNKLAFDDYVMGFSIRKLFTENILVASTETGSMSLHSNINVLDVLGLSNPDVAFENLLTGKKRIDPSWKRSNPYTIIKHNPEVIAACAQVVPNKEEYFNKISIKSFLCPKLLRGNFENYIGDVDTLESLYTPLLLSLEYSNDPIMSSLNRRNEVYFVSLFLRNDISLNKKVEKIFFK